MGKVRKGKVREQSKPLPSNPALHWHMKPPIVLPHSVLTLQLLRAESPHSFISMVILLVNNGGNLNY